MKKIDFEKISYRAEYVEIMETLRLRSKYAVSSRRIGMAIFLLQIRPFCKSSDY